MYLNHEESMALAEALSTLSYDTHALSLAVFPTTLSLVGVQQVLQESTIEVGSQHTAWTSVGPYTGAVSASFVKDTGATYTLVGHSERRHVFGESNEDIRKRLDAALDVGLRVVLCIGETREDLDAGKREYRLKKQLVKALEGRKINPANIFIAYEPVWAISNGDRGIPCAPFEAEEVHAWIKQELATYDLQNAPVLYGGSVNAKNVVSYMSLPSVDGVLVGSASTKIEEYTSLIDAVDSNS